MSYLLVRRFRGQNEEIISASLLLAGPFLCGNKIVFNFRGENSNNLSLSRVIFDHGKSIYLSFITYACKRIVTCLVICEDKPFICCRFVV